MAIGITGVLQVIARKCKVCDNKLLRTRILPGNVVQSYYTGHGLINRDRATEFPCIDFFDVGEGGSCHI